MPEIRVEVEITTLGQVDIVATVDVDFKYGEPASPEYDDPGSGPEIISQHEPEFRFVKENDDPGQEKKSTLISPELVMWLADMTEKDLQEHMDTVVQFEVDKADAEGVESC